MIKIYQCIADNKLVTIINTPSGKRRIEFSGGDSNFKGTFTTSEKALQDAIEKSPAYNRTYTLHRVVMPHGEEKLPSKINMDKINKQSNPVPKAIETAKKEQAAAPVKAKVEPEKPKGKAPLVFRTINEAQTYFTAPPYNIPKNALRSSAMIIQKAASLGVTVDFQK